MAEKKKGKSFDLPICFKCLADEPNLEFKSGVPLVYATCQICSGYGASAKAKYFKK